MGFGSFFASIGHDIAQGLNTVTSALNVVDRYVNPFHVETSNQSPQDQQAHDSFLGKTVVNNSVLPSVEATGKAVDWLYTNGISHPLSTALMAGELPGGPFRTANWADAWRAAQHISPGQALFLNSQQTQAAVNSPLTYFKPAASMLPPGFDQLSDAQQQELLRQAGMPAVGNQYIENLRNESGVFKWASGVGDFALHWEADPTVLAGKVAGAVREAQVVKVRPASGWSAADIDKIMSDSTMAKAQQFIWENRANPALLNNLQMAKGSALGPRFGAIASTLQSPAEVADFLRVGMGDVNAIERLTATNKLAAARIEQDTSRLSALDLMRTRYADAAQPQMVQMISDHMDRLNEQINADEALVQRYNQILDHSEELDKVNLSRWSFARAQQRTEAQATYRAGAAVGGGALRERLPQGMQRAAVVDGTAQYVTTPLEGGLVKSRIYGLGDFFSRPVTMVRSLSNFRPNGYMRLDDIDADSVNELRGQLARIPGITAMTRQKILNEYLQTTSEGDRLRLVNEVGQLGAAKVAAKHGLEPELGQDIYKAHLERQVGEAENARRYSAAWKTLQTEGGLRQVRVDEFAADGGKLVVHPNLVTRLANDHVFQDLDALDKVLARHASPLRAIRESRLGNPDWITDAADYLTHLFKFSTLFRLGYIPRVLGDDVTGQWARVGAASMAARIGWGVRNGLTNAAMMLARPYNQAIEQTSREAVRYAEQEMAHLQADMDSVTPQVVARQQSNALDLSRAQQRLDAAQARWDNLPPDAPAALRGAVNRLVFKRQGEVSAAKLAQHQVGSPGRVLDDLKNQHAFLTAQRDAAQARADNAVAQQQKVIQGSQSVVINGKVFPAAFSGPNGEMYQALLSPDEALGNIFATNKQLIHGNLMRSYNHGGRVIRASEDEDLHALSWSHAINAQLAQDQLARLAIQGASPADMARWLTTTAAGRAYRRRLGVQFTTADELANAAWHDVAEYLPTPEIRQAALEGGVKPSFLKEQFPNMADRPEVHTGMVGLQGQLKYKRALDRVVQSWFKFASTIPAERMSRHPLFNQLYEGHLKTLTAQRAQQGGWTVSDVEDMTRAARRLALRDTRRLVFDIAHRSDAAAALRFISPFFPATAEAFQRWGRIIADKPQVVGYAANFFNAPLATGHMQDQDGNTVMRDGTTIDPTTGKRVMVPKSQRYIVARMPKWLVDSPLGLALGVERASGNMTLSQNSMNLVTQGDPWWNPGTGPVVSIPVNELVKDKPKQAEMARQLGILPFGPEVGAPGDTSLAGRVVNQMLPSTIKDFLTAFDTSDTRYQQVKLQIMQRAAYEHDQLGKPMPSASQIASMTKDYWLFTAASAFLQPMSTRRRDAYQFYRDQYNNLLRANPLTADDQFLSKFGESYFVFAQSQSKNVGGISATQKAVALTKQYGDLIAANPELAALIVGPEGNGPFSPEAYAYQLTTPLAPGGAEMQRTKMSAEQAMQENQRRLGWAKYIAMVNRLTSDLHNRGLQSFSDPGAEDLRSQKQAYTALYSQPLYPDGTANPYYNAAWSKDYYSLDPLKYDRLIPGLTALANSPLAQQPARTDLRTLQQYLGGRQQIMQELQARGANGGAKTLTAKGNADLALAWTQFVDGLIESDTRFGDLYSRYLARDLGVDAVPAASTAA